MMPEENRPRKMLSVGRSADGEWSRAPGILVANALTDFFYSFVRFQMKLLAYLCLVFILGFPQLSFGCRPIVGHKYPVPTEAELFAKADLVFSGTVIQVRDAPELTEETRHPSTVVVTMKVQKWEKGSEGELLRVVDTTGTDCDSLFGVFHIELPNRNAVPSPGWRVFARKSNGHIFAITVSYTK